MPEKRYVNIEHKGADYILDNPNYELDFIEMLGDSLNFDEIVNKLNEQDNEIQAQVNVIKGYQERNEKLFKETQELQKRIDRQAELLQKQGEKIDNFIDIKAKLDGKIQEYTTKSEEYELSACSCGARINAYKKQALEELKEELFC